MNTKRISKAVAVTVAVVGIAAPVAQAHYSATDGQSGYGSGPTLGVQVVADRPDVQANPADSVQIVSDRPDVKANPALDRGVQIVSDRPEFRTSSPSRTRVVSQPDSGGPNWTNVGIASALGLALLLMAAAAWQATRRQDGQVAAA